MYSGMQHTREYMAHCRLRHTASVTYLSLKCASSKQSKYGLGHLQEWHSIFLTTELVLAQDIEKDGMATETDL